jgi:hypothetical protein
MPAGYTNVAMGQAKGARTTDPGLYSGLFGTCVGIIITGTPKTPTSHSRYLMHLAMGDWDSVKKPYADFVTAVQASGMTNMRAWLYTIDTTLNKDPEYKNDPDMKNEAAGIAEIYGKVKVRLQALVGANPVNVQTHSFTHTGEMSVSQAGVPTFATI